MLRTRSQSSARKSAFNDKYPQIGATTRISTSRRGSSSRKNRSVTRRSVISGEPAPLPIHAKFNIRNTRSEARNRVSAAPDMVASLRTLINPQAILRLMMGTQLLMLERRRQEIDMRCNGYDSSQRRLEIRQGYAATSSLLYCHLRAWNILPPQGCTNKIRDLCCQIAIDIHRFRMNWSPSRVDDDETENETKILSEELQVILLRHDVCFLRTPEPSSSRAESDAYCPKPGALSSPMAPLENDVIYETSVDRQRSASQHHQARAFLLPENFLKTEERHMDCDDVQHQFSVRQRYITATSILTVCLEARGFCLSKEVTDELHRQLRQLVQDLYDSQRGCMVSKLHDEEEESKAKILWRSCSRSIRNLSRARRD